MTKTIALIPARYAATRLPGKLMKILHGKTIIHRTYEAVRQTNLFNEVYVVSDNELIRHEVNRLGGQVIMSQKNHESGTDRIAEAAENLVADIIVNIQGDEPFIEADSLKKLIGLFDNPLVEIGSLMIPIDNEEKMKDPNCVKVVVDIYQKALYFSRSPIPYPRAEVGPNLGYQHVGVYAFRPSALKKFTQLPVSPLEAIEKLENLRMLENGMDVYLALINHIGISIDTEDDFNKAEDYLNGISI